MGTNAARYISPLQAELRRVLQRCMALAMASTPPTIFAESRRKAARHRLRHLQEKENSARFVAQDMVDEVIERLAFVQFAPKRALVLGDWTGLLANHLRQAGSEVTPADIVDDDSDAIELDKPYPLGGFDLVVCLGLLDTVNDLPGALIHMCNALVPGGMAIASFPGGESLSALRGIMLAADGDRPAARIHPMVDVRAGAQLIQRAGWADPVVDSHVLRVRYRTLEQLVEDLRAQGLSCALSSHAPHPGKAGFVRAGEAFAARADEDGRVTENFEIVTLTGRKR